VSAVLAFDAIAAPDALRELERVAARLTASIAPLRIGVARDAADLDAVFRLRGAEIIERGWAAPESLPSGRDHDEHDDDAVQIALWDDAEVVGTCRVLLPSPHRLLPIEREFGLRLEPPGGVVQWSRLVLAPRWRGDPQHRLAIACFAAMWLETRRRGYEACAGVVAKPMLALYAGMGMAFDVLAPPRVVDGEERYPALSSAATLRTALVVMQRLV
jgi:N-acyl-L-homoserine lactone synthetase